jgi:pilus assembly protein CpaF
LLPLRKVKKEETKAEMHLEIEAACTFIQEYLSSNNTEDWVTIFREGLAGSEADQQRAKEIIARILTKEKIVVTGFENEPVEATAEAIYVKQFGLADIDPYYNDKAVDEIRVAPGGKIYVTRRGIHESTGRQIEPSRIVSIIERLRPFDDTGNSLDEGNPQLEFVRKDGSRVTALCFPVTSTHCFAIRKHGNIELSPESLISLKTIDAKTWRILSILVKSRRNLLICGSTNSGKTTLMKLLIGELDPKLSIRVLDSDNELRASQLYPEREIWELEAHPEVGAPMDILFTRILRLTPDLIIVPEFRGGGEVWTTVEACTRGHEGSMASAHFSSFASPEEAIRNIAMLAVKEGVNLPLQLVMEKVAQAFQILIQTFADSKTGIKKVVSISEIYLENDHIRFRPLVRWTPSDQEDYFGEGRWVVENKPTENCIKAMAIFGCTAKDINEAFD